MTTAISAQQFPANPYPVYTAFRKEQKLGTMDNPFDASLDATVVTRYADVAAILKDSRFSNDRRNQVGGFDFANAWWVPNFYKALSSNLLSTDAPDHTRLRNLVHKGFTPRMVRNLDAQIVRITTALLDNMAGNPEVDLMKDFALPLPLIVISEMMGVPEHDREHFHKLSAAFVEDPGGSRFTILKQMPTFFGLQRFFKKLIQSKRQNPGDDLTSALVQAEEAGDRLSENELIAMLFLLLVAGHETTVNLIGNGMLALLENPDQLEKLKQQPDLIDSAIEELLRYANPVQYVIPRFAKEDLELNGNRLHKGEMLILFIAAANRDEAVFENAEQLDITRSPNKHLAFGNGIHYCLGAPLARLEAKRAFSMLLERYPDLELAVPAETLKWRNTRFVHGLEALPLVLERKSA